MHNATACMSASVRSCSHVADTFISLESFKMQTGQSSIRALFGLLIATCLMAGCETQKPVSSTTVRDQPRYCASHILIAHKDSSKSDTPVTRTKEEALDLAKSIAEKARQPDADFAELARQNSDGPSKSEGGMLGEFGLNDMVRPFSIATAKLEIGAISDPVETQFGYHIILRHRLPVVISIREILITYTGSKYEGSPVSRSKDDAKTAAEDCLQQAKDDADFARLAKKFSDDGGGELLQVTEGTVTLPEAWTDAVFKLKVDETVVVETEYGFHVVRRFE